MNHGTEQFTYFTSFMNFSFSLASFLTSLLRELISGFKRSPISVTHADLWQYLFASFAFFAVFIGMSECQMISSACSIFSCMSCRRSFAVF
ncbi:MAG: hypothetical protein ACI4KO_09730, partial [Ruminiclostridium sp.]